MLYASLVVSLLLVLLAWWAVRRSDRAIATFIACVVGLNVCPVGLMALLPAAGLHSLLLGAAVIAACNPRRRSWPFLPVAGAITVVVYPVVGWFAYQDHTRLREKFPYVSLEARLPLRAGPKAGALPLQTAEHLDSLERTILSNGSRAYRLEALHEHALQAFINHPGFGVMRMSGISEPTLTHGLRTEPPLLQPGPRLPSASQAASVDARAAGDPDAASYNMHDAGVIDFVNPDGFGYVKDRQHVAGFQAHQFSMVPQAQRWHLQTLDLVGLVIHDEPVAYVSANLPRMDELRDAPTRPLDDFETAGLAALRRGEDLYVREGTEVRRMLGSIHSTKQCLSCHGGQRGDLLGAFSYTFAQGNR